MVRPQEGGGGGGKGLLEKGGEVLFQIIVD